MNSGQFSYLLRMNISTHDCIHLHISEFKNHPPIIKCIWDIALKEMLNGNAKFCIYKKKMLIFY